MRYSIAIALLVFAVVFGPVGSDPIGVLVGLALGGALGALWAYDRGWNSHVEHVHDAAVERADEQAERERR